MSGTVISIHTTAEKATPTKAVESVRAVPGYGLDGDRHFKSHKPHDGRDVTLIELEAIEALKRDYEIDLPLGDSRRNIVTRGVALNHLVGREFTVGNVRLRGVMLCEPCSHLAKLTHDRVTRGLVHRGGLRCDVLTEGMIRVGDAIAGL